MRYVALLTLISAYAAVNATAQQAIRVQLPAVIHECDSVPAYNVNNCTDWNTVGPNTQRYDGEWTDGSQGIMTVKRFTETDVLIERYDAGGQNGGMNFTYQGKIHDGRIEGTFVMIRAGSPVYSGIWKATFEGTASPTSSDPPVQPHQSVSRVVPHNVIVKTHGRAGHVPPAEGYAEGPALIICLFAWSKTAKPDDPPAACEVTAPELAATVIQSSKSIRSPAPGTVTLTCRGGVGDVSCGVRVETAHTVPE